jgi:ABC-type branched-subunit amino acid transport system substrate-binding protein
MTANRNSNLNTGLTGFALGAVVTLLATIAFVPNNTPGVVRVVPGGADAATGVVDNANPSGTGGDASAGGVGVPSGGSGAKSKAASAQPGGGPAAASSACKAGANGGATDVGVAGDSIKLGATVAESGIAASFLGQVRLGMQAVVNKVNRSGGICGRKLAVTYKDDAWVPDTGARYLQNMVEGDKVFALAVVPSSEGLNQVALTGYFGKNGVPVVGSDGMIRSQYTDPSIWPVASATTTTIHVMLKDAFNRGARHPAIVFESSYRFGIEGAYAFEKAYERLTNGDKIPGYYNPLASGNGSCSDNSRFCGISSGQSYGNQVSVFNKSCDTEPKCDYVILLLEPQTAQDWMSVPGAHVPDSYQYGMGGAQPLFTYAFANNCSDRCAHLRVWTGYNPPIEQYAGTPAVNAYVNDLGSVSAQADVYNQFTEGGYLGMELVVEALQRVGPNLTRARLREVLDSMQSWDSGLTRPMTFARGKHFANGAAQAFEVQARNGFTGWRFVQDYLADTWLGEDVS